MKTAPVWIALLGILLITSCQTRPATAEIAQTKAAISAARHASLTATAEAQEIAFQKLTAEAPTATDTPQPTPTLNRTHINYMATSCWVDTGVHIDTGQQVAIGAFGKANTWDGKDISDGGPDGQPKHICGDVSCPVMGANYGALIGRIGEGKTFVIGYNLEFTAAKSGDLYITINDWQCEDNSGRFVVTVTIH